MHRPGLAVANSFANIRKCITELIFPLTSMGCWPWDHPPGDQCPSLDPEG